LRCSSSRLPRTRSNSGSVFFTASLSSVQIKQPLGHLRNWRPRFGPAFLTMCNVALPCGHDARGALPAAATTLGALASAAWKCVANSPSASSTSLQSAAVYAVMYASRLGNVSGRFCGGVAASEAASSSVGKCRLLMLLTRGGRGSEAAGDGDGLARASRCRSFSTDEDTLEHSPSSLVETVAAVSVSLMAAAAATLRGHSNFARL